MPFAPLLALLALTGCKGCRDTQPAPPPIIEPTVAPESPPAPPTAPAPIQEMARNFERVLFDLDSTTINTEGKAALDANAAIMSEYSDIKLEVQGHADERGTTDYNLALGQKRADAVVQYLMARGISSSRVKSVSYGEERPIDGQSTERAWAQNRRAEFVIVYSGGEPVRGTTN